MLFTNKQKNQLAMIYNQAKKNGNHAALIVTCKEYHVPPIKHDFKPL